MIGLLRAYEELKKQALLEKMPTFIGVQAEGCSPIAKAFHSGAARVQRIDKSNTVAQSITNPDPPGGNLVLNKIRKNNGSILAVSDVEILRAQKMLAEKEGLFCLPASATTLAGFLQMSKVNAFKDTDKVVLVASGTGMKNLKVLDSSSMHFNHSTLSTLEDTLLSAVE